MLHTIDSYELRSSGNEVNMDRDTIIRRLEMIAKSLEQSHEVKVDFQYLDCVP